MLLIFSHEIQFSQEGAQNVLTLQHINYFTSFHLEKKQNDLNHVVVKSFH